ncbi:hypothetical protein SELMODRAFT_423874 [Selaginella moellendorffii]|uniref:beta-glucosidase n=1 Tax=Selaginella moellendorffii TaxID=88036 RepID=D8SN31_SELML|nr:hypothetical protein SELMODRAFT_423874 [Selaginella moellendorffii]
MASTLFTMSIKPCIGRVCQDPRWGRCFRRCYSEKPQLVKAMTTIISGLQAAACSKHYELCQQEFVIPDWQGIDRITKPGTYLHSSRLSGIDMVRNACFFSPSLPTGALFFLLVSPEDNDFLLHHGAPYEYTKFIGTLTSLVKEGSQRSLSKTASKALVAGSNLGNQWLLVGER